MGTSVLTCGLHSSYYGTFSYTNGPPVNPQIVLSDGNDSTYMTLYGTNPYIVYTLTDLDELATIITGAKITFRMKNGQTVFADMQNKLDYVQLVKPDGTPLTSQAKVTSTNTLTTYNVTPSIVHIDKQSWAGARLKLKTTGSVGGTIWTDISVTISWYSIYVSSGVGFKFSGEADVDGGSPVYFSQTTGVGFKFGGSASIGKIYEYEPTGVGFKFGGSAAIYQDGEGYAPSGEGFLFSGEAVVTSGGGGGGGSSTSGVLMRSGGDYGGSYYQILVSELIEKTKRGSIVWDKLRPATYKTHWQINDRYYDVFVTYLKSNYSINFIINGRSVIDIDANKVSKLADLYQVIEICISQKNDFLIAIQNQ